MMDADDPDKVERLRRLRLQQAQGSAKKVVPLAPGPVVELKKAKVSVVREGFTIDKNVPIPEQVRAYSRYPFPVMEVNESFFVAREGRVMHRLKAKIQSAKDSWCKTNKRDPKDFVIRVIQEEDGVRVWRVR